MVQAYRVAILCGLWASCNGGPAQAQTAPRTIDEVVACRAITETDRRLACYDKTTASLAKALGSGDLIALNHKDVVRKQKQTFGLPPSRHEEPSDPLGSLKTIEAKIVEVRPAGYDRFRLAIAGNGIWETVEHLSLPPEPGNGIIISRTNFGGFKAKIGARRPVLVKRVR